MPPRRPRRYDIITGPAAKAILSRDAGFEWVPRLRFSTSATSAQRFVYPPAPTSEDLGIEEALDASRRAAHQRFGRPAYGVFAVEPPTAIVEYAGLVARDG